jgi:hypothetical protein
MTKARKKSAKGYVTEVSIETLDRLRQAYGIEGGDYFSLALQLAIDYVPGFPRFKLQHGDYGKVMRDKGGRPTEWPPEKRDELITAVDRVKKEHGFATDDEALKHLTMKEKWARPPRQDDSAKWIKRLKNELGRERSIRRWADDLQKSLEKIRSSNPEN